MAVVKGSRDLCSLAVEHKFEERTRKAKDGGEGGFNTPSPLIHLHLRGCEVILVCECHKSR
jgi:hypothetical protein